MEHGSQVSHCMEYGYSHYRAHTLLPLSAALGNWQMYKVGRFETHELTPFGSVQVISKPKCEPLVQCQREGCNTQECDSLAAHYKACGSRHCTVHNVVLLSVTCGTRKSCRLDRFVFSGLVPFGTMPYQLLSPKSNQQLKHTCSVDHLVLEEELLEVVVAYLNVASSLLTLFDLHTLPDR